MALLLGCDDTASSGGATLTDTQATPDVVGTSVDEDSSGHTDHDVHAVADIAVHDAEQVADAGGPSPDVAEVEPGSAPLPPGLYGEAPPDALPLPEFVATNFDGGARGPADLVGHPTVVWFFPFAGTPG